MKVFQGLSLFVGLIVLGHGAYSAPEVDSVGGKQFSVRIDFYRDIVKAYADGRMNLTGHEESLLVVKRSELETIYTEINQEFSSYSELSSIPCSYARDHNKIVSRMLGKLGDMISTNDTMILILKGIMRDSVKLCRIGYSPREFFYDLYNMTVLTEWKGYTMLTKFNDLLNSGKTSECFDENKNEADQDKNYTSLHENRLVIYSNMFKLMMEWIKCIPEFHACDEYHDFTKDLGVFKSPSDLNEKIYRWALLIKWAGARFRFSLHV